MIIKKTMRFIKWHLSKTENTDICMW